MAQIRSGTKSGGSDSSFNPFPKMGDFKIVPEKEHLSTNYTSMYPSKLNSISEEREQT